MIDERGAPVERPWTGRRWLARLLPTPEVIGPPDCPILWRWTLLRVPPWRGRRDEGVRKVMLHRFAAFADDRDVHDHPWPFWTLCLAGGYDDLVPCGRCEGTGELAPRPTAWPRARGCVQCGRTGLVVGDRLRRGSLRRRPAHHRHRTRSGERGAWTLVATGARSRQWGFWRDGMWWEWSAYERRFGFAMRCDDLPLEDRRRA